MGAVLLLNIAEDFDVLATKFLPESKEFSSASFDQASAANVSKDKAFDAYKIEIGGGSDFKRCFVYGFEQLEPDWPGEALANGTGNPLHEPDGRWRERWFDV